MNEARLRGTVGASLVAAGSNARIGLGIAQILGGRGLVHGGSLNGILQTS